MSKTKDAAEEGVDLKNEITAANVQDDVATIKHGEAEETAHGNYKRTITPRQIHVISLGYCMGSGLFIGTGQSIATGGPANVLIAYAIAVSCVWAVLQTLAEMTIAFPVSGNIFDYADRWVDPSIAFAAGFAEWLGWAAVVGAEAAWMHVLISYWGGASVPPAASYTILCSLTFLLFSMPTKAFAWFMYLAALVKVALFFIIVGTSLAVIAGAGSSGTVNNGSTWRDQDPFKNGFSGFANVALFAIWATGDQVFMGIMGGEAENPRYSMAHATKLVPWRIITVFMTIVILVGVLVSSDDERLLLGKTISSSPFVIAAADAGIPGIPHIINAGVIVAVLSMSAESIYISSRVLRTMALQKLVPTFIAKIDNRGRPRWAIAITAAAASISTYINLASSGALVFQWLISVTSSAYFMNWIIISVTSYRFHAALKAQNDPLLTQLYAWNSTLWPLAPAWLFICSVMFFICCFYVGIKPLGGESFSATNFFQYIIGILIITVFSIVYKLVMRTPWRDPATADLQSGRRNLSAEEIAQLDAYYAQPKWRRFLQYVQLW